MLRLFPRATDFGGGVPEEYFTICWNGPRGTHDDHVSDEAAASIHVAAVVDVRSFDEDASGMVGCFPLLLLGWLGPEMILQSGSRATEDIEGDDSLD